jgi:hypothetical protein
MELDALQAAWQNSSPAPKTNAELRSMMQERTHPILKRIRRQLIIESIAYTFFLFAFYNMFDGDQKPVYVNVLLVTAMLFALVHNITGYRLAKGGVTGIDLRAAMNGHLSKLRVYAFISVISRVLVAACLLFFFSSVITFTAKKYWLLAGIIIIFMLQVIFLSEIWWKRIRQVRQVIDNLG